jgi:hypothetical protein
MDRFLLISIFVLAFAVLPYNYGFGQYYDTEDLINGVYVGSGDSVDFARYYGVGCGYFDDSC